MKKKAILIIFIIVISGLGIPTVTFSIINNNLIDSYDKLSEMYEDLTEDYNTLNNTYNELLLNISVSEPIYYFAIDDIGISGTTTNPFSSSVKITYDLPRLYFGCSQTGTANPSLKGFLMRFNLVDKPVNWSKCEISLYLYKNVYYGYWMSARVYLFEGNWTEEEEWDGYGNYMRDIEVYWKFEDHIGVINNRDIGFRKIDITDYINNITTTTFSIAVMQKRLERYNGYGYIYSSEWDGSDPAFPYILPENDSYNNYLPQLIWS